MAQIFPRPTPASLHDAAALHAPGGGHTPLATVCACAHRAVHQSLQCQGTSHGNEVPTLSAQLLDSSLRDRDPGWSRMSRRSNITDRDSDTYLRFSEHEHLEGISNVTVMRLARRVLSTSVPLSVFPAMECGLLLISVRFAAVYSSHHGIHYLSGTALALAWGLITLSFASACIHGVFDVVLEAHTNGSYVKVAQTVQAALVVSVVCAVVLVPFWVLCGPVMQALHQHPSSATVSSDFLKYALIGLTQLLCYRVLAQYLRARHSVAALFAVNAAVLVMHYFISDLFVNGAGTWQGMGFVGVPLALAIAWTLQFVFSTVYLVVSGLMVELRAGVPTDALRPAAMADVVRAGKGLGFLEMLEMIVYFCPSILAGFLPVGSVSAQGIVSTVYLTLWLLFQGSGLAAHKLVRESVRDGAGEEARNVVIIATAQSTVLAFVASTLLYLFSTPVAKAFTSSPVIADLAADALQISALCLFCDISGFTARGVLRGIERKGRGGAVYAVASYVVGVPLYAVLAFVVEDSISGFWEARVGLMIVVLVIVLGMLLTTSWRHEAGRAQVHNFAPVPTLEAQTSVGSQGTAFVKL